MSTLESNQVKVGELQIQNTSTIKPPPICIFKKIFTSYSKFLATLIICGRVTLIVQLDYLTNFHDALLKQFHSQIFRKLLVVCLLSDRSSSDFIGEKKVRFDVAQNWVVMILYVLDICVHCTLCNPR